MIVHRIVLQNPPALEDLVSPAGMGEHPPTGDPRVARLWEGISVFRTMQQARNRALRSTHLGSYIAVLDLVESGPIQCERTGLTRGHYTVWGDPVALLAAVVNVVPVREL